MKTNNEWQAPPQTARTVQFSIWTEEVTPPMTEGKRLVMDRRFAFSVNGERCTKDEVMYPGDSAQSDAIQPDEIAAYRRICLSIACGALAKRLLDCQETRDSAKGPPDGSDGTCFTAQFTPTKSGGVDVDVLKGEAVAFRVETPIDEGADEQARQNRLYCLMGALEHQISTLFCPDDTMEWDWNDQKKQWENGRYPGDERKAA